MKDENTNSPSPTTSPPPAPSTTPQSQIQVGNLSVNNNQIKNTPPLQTGGLENYATTPTSPQTGSKSASGKIIATVFSVLILVGGVAAGVFLVGKQQEIRSKASEQNCLQSENCIVIQNPDDSGSYQVNGIIYDVFLTDENANIFGAGLTEDGCYQSSIEGDSLSWEKIGSESECENLVNIQVWMIEIPQQTLEPVVSQCREIKIYDTEWNKLSAEELDQLTSGDTILISVSSTTSAGTIDQARFTINNQQQQPSTLKKPGTNELYMLYSIPEEENMLEIDVELYHSTFGWF